MVYGQFPTRAACAPRLAMNRTSDTLSRAAPRRIPSEVRRRGADSGASRQARAARTGLGHGAAETDLCRRRGPHFKGHECRTGLALRNGDLECYPAAWKICRGALESRRFRASRAGRTHRPLCTPLRWGSRCGRKVTGLKTCSGVNLSNRDRRSMQRTILPHASMCRRRFEIGFANC